MKEVALSAASGSRRTPTAEKQAGTHKIRHEARALMSDPHGTCLNGGWMARAKRICPKPGCPSIATNTYCPRHQAEHERMRGSREQRGYDHAHRELRKQWAPKVATGGVICGKCGNTIQPGATWHLGHTDSRDAWTGPEHAQCNLSDAGRRSHRPT